MKNVRVDVTDPLDVRVMLDRSSDTPGPSGETKTVRLTLPAKPLTLVKMAADEFDEPG